MQTELRLFQIPDIDTHILSGIGEFHDRVEEFERKWNIKLEFSPNARWRPGSYERLKGQVIKSLYPHWEKPRGANTIRKLTKFDQYRTSGLAKELVSIDNELRGFRNNKIHLEGDKAALEGKSLLMELMENYGKMISDTYVDITPVPYWNRTRHQPIGYVRPIVPKIITSDGLLPNPMEGFAVSEKDVKDKITQASKSKNPKRWYVNIIVAIRDIHLHYYRTPKEETLLAKIPWGNLYVGFTIPLYDLVMSYRKIKNSGLNSPIDDKRFSNHTYKFPTIPGIQHPFVNRARNTETNTYEWGNTCFGSWKTEVIASLCTGNLAHLKAVLICWAEVYHCNNTSPLNQPESTHLEQHIDWPKGIVNYLRTSPTTCRAVVKEGYSTIDLTENHCIVCALREMGDCTYFEELTYVPYDMPKEFLDVLQEKLIKREVNPALEYIVIKRLTQKMWSMKSRVTDAQFNSWFYIQDSGTGCMNYQYLLTELDMLNTLKTLHYSKKSVDWSEIANTAINLYNYAERVYWTQCIAKYNSEAWDNLRDNYYFESIENANDGLPISDLQSMIYSYRLQSGSPGTEPAYSTYMADIYQLNKPVDDSAQSVEEAVDELNEHQDTTNEESEGPF